MTIEMLEIVDENDHVIGTAPRKDIHQKGLLHREISVWFVTPDSHLILQRRSANKDTYPGQLDATTSGHVEIGDSYIVTALKEVEEETGLRLQQNDLIDLGRHKLKFDDPGTGLYNHRFQNMYAYPFTGKVSDLKIEEGKADGFELFKINAIFSMSPDEQLLFPFFDPDTGKVIYQKLLALV
jgi:isopentenyl-diphosphate delta-isomerase